MKEIKLLFLCVATVFLTSCGNDKNSEESSEEGALAPREAKGPVILGGSFTMATDEDFANLFPHKVKDLNSWHAAAQIYEGLLKIDPVTLNYVPAIAAESPLLDDSKTVYTFKLRDDVYFHDDPCFPNGKGRKVTAQDFKYSFELLSKKQEDNSGFEAIFKGLLEGADDYHNGHANEISGIKVVDDHTLQLTLNKPFPMFEYRLTSPNAAVVAKEAYEKYGEESTVGTGPFVYRGKNEDAGSFILTRNVNYYKHDEHGNQLPYLDTVEFIVMATKTIQLDAFQKGKLNLIDGLPADKISKVVEEFTMAFTDKPPKYILYGDPQMSTHYYEFNLTEEHFKDPRVRKAFNHAINKNKIVTEILQGQAFKPGVYGIVPPVQSLLVKMTDSDTVRYELNEGYDYNPELAKRLMAEAGYPNGKGFPSIDLNLNPGGNNKAVATEITNQLYSILGVNVNTNIVTFADKIDDASHGRTDMVRGAWIADYPDPETFLYLFYGKNVPSTLDSASHPNSMRYVNPEFDELFEKGAASFNMAERYQYFSEAERIMLRDCPMIILWYDKSFTVLHSNVRNFNNNSMSYIDFSTVYLKDLTPEEHAETQGK